MPALDPRYIVILGFLTAILISGVLFMVRRVFADTIPGLTAWSWGCLSIAVASPLFLIRLATESLLSIVVANALLTAGFLAMHVGLRAFTGQSVNYGRLAGAWLGLACLLILSNYGDQYLIGTILVSLFNGTVFLISSTTVLRIRRIGLVEWLTSGAFSLAAIISYARSLTALLGVHAPSNLYDPTLVQMVYVASFPFVVLSTSIGFILMVYGRARAIVIGMNANLETAVEKRTAELRDEIARRRALEGEVAQLVEKERRRIGQELHDNLGQRMTGLSLLAESLAIKLRGIAPDLCDQANALERTASDAVLETRRLAHGLIPVIPGAEGLRTALAKLADNASLGGKLKCTLRADALIEIGDEYVATHLFRIAQESVSNLIRHGHATVAELRLHRVGGKTTLRITDNGEGFANREDDQGSGQGLRIMAYRASLIGYDFKIEGAPGAGTTITVREL